MEKLLTVLLLNLSVVPVLAGAIFAYAALRQFVHIRWGTPPLSMRILGWLVQCGGVLWTFVWCIIVLQNNLWDNWPLSGVYWAYLIELPAWIQAWCFILLPSIPGLVAFADTRTLSGAAQPQHGVGRLLMATLPVLIVALMLVAPFAAQAV